MYINCIYVHAFICNIMYAWMDGFIHMLFFNTVCLFVPLIIDTTSSALL